jgi:hypothetical protein
MMAGRWPGVVSLSWKSCVGAFGDACRLAKDDVAAMLRIIYAAWLPIILLRASMRLLRRAHFYHQWLTTPASAGLIDHKDMLGWLGDWCQADKHPVSWSVTQNWQTVALGMPRLCSAKRLVEAMVEEIFG